MKQSNKNDVITKTPYESFSMTQQEVAEVMGVDRGYVSILEARAKAKVKAKLEERGYKVEDFFGGMA